MIRYSYLAQLRPPAPFVYIKLRNPITGAELLNVPAQLDCAADRTVVPEALAKSLALPQIGAITIGGVGGLTQSMPSYPVELTIHDLQPLTFEVVASAGENWGYLDVTS